MSDVADSARQQGSTGLAHLQQQLQALHAAGAPGFDPVRLRFLESLLRRAHAVQGATRQVLTQRIQRLLAQFQADFEQAQARARATGKALINRSPETNPQLVRMFRAGEFRNITRLAQRLSSPPHSALTALLQTLEPEERLLAESTDPLTFDETLRQQELEALQTNGLSSLTSHLRSRVDSDELRSMRHFRDVLARRTIERAVTTAMEEVPENAGPLNAHLLVVQAITTMRDIAPEYLNRFVSYIDTLLWLDQAGAQFPQADDKGAEGKIRSRKSPGKPASRDTKNKN